MMSLGFISGLGWWRWKEKVMFCEGRRSNRWVRREDMLCLSRAFDVDILPVKRDLDVVLCHVTADYDTLAAAVGLAKFRGGNTIVVLSGGSNPTVERFLSLFQPLFPIRNPKNVNPHHIRWIGVVDCSRKNRLGTCAAWLNYADAIEVYDHHIQKETLCDLTSKKGKVMLFEEPVGAATTMIVEKLSDADVHITPGEATLMALGIHSDTGSFLFENTGPRDARALAWLLERGANQKTVIEYKSALLNQEQRSCLNEGIRNLKKETVNGIVVGHCYLQTEDFVKGLSPVAQNIIEITSIDVLVFTVVNALKKKKHSKKVSQGHEVVSTESTPPQKEDVRSEECERRQLSIIVRSRPRVHNLDLGEIVSRWGGGGHAKAAAVTIRTDRHPHDLNKEIVDAICDDLFDSNPIADQDLPLNPFTKT